MSDEIEWGNYPEIGEYDWLLVVERVNEIRRSLERLGSDARG